jgi:transposase
MRQKSVPEKEPAEHPSRDAATLLGGRQDRIVLEGLRGEDSIAELCRREGIGHLRLR